MRLVHNSDLNCPIFMVSPFSPVRPLAPPDLGLRPIAELGPDRILAMTSSPSLDPHLTLDQKLEMWKTKTPTSGLSKIVYIYMKFICFVSGSLCREPNPREA